MFPKFENTSLKSTKIVGKKVFSAFRGRNHFFKMFETGRAEIFIYCNVRKTCIQIPNQKKTFSDISETCFCFSKVLKVFVRHLHFFVWHFENALAKFSKSFRTLNSTIFVERTDTPLLPHSFSQQKSVYPNTSKSE